MGGFPRIQGYLLGGPCNRGSSKSQANLENYHIAGSSDDSQGTLSQGTLGVGLSYCGALRDPSDIIGFRV